MSFTKSISLESRFLALVQSRGLEKLVAGDLESELGLTIEQERKLLSRLSRAGLISRVRRGLYLVSSSVTRAGAWHPGEFRLLSELMAGSKAAFQVTGPAAFHRYGWTEQVPNELSVYNDRLSGRRVLGSLSLTLIKLASARLGEIEIMKTPDGIEIPYSSRARALIDAVYDWSRFNSLPRAFDWICCELRKDDSLAAKLVEAAIKFGNLGTRRRIGRLLEVENGPDALLRKLEMTLSDSSGLISWNPLAPRRGRLDRRWGLILNAEKINES